jgi:hypothetical protein
MAVVSKRLGHSSITITRNTYSHLLEGVGHSAAEAEAALVPRGARPVHTSNTEGVAEGIERGGRPSVYQRQHGAPSGT